MKRIVAFICILVLCFSLCACGKSPRSGNLPRTSQSAIESQSVSESDSISKDIYPSEPIDYEEYISKVQYDEDVRIDAGALIDNETPVSSFLQQQGKVSSVDTEAVLNYGRRFSRYNDDAAPDRSIDWVEKSLGQKVLFVRSGNEFQNSKTNENGIRCYTVFESEKGGYLYFFFDYYPDTQKTKMSIVCYASKAMDYAEALELSNMNSRKKFIEKLPEYGYMADTYNGNTVLTSQLLTDGVFFVGVRGNSDELNGGNYVFDRFIIPPMSETHNEADNYDVTILPQDYPPED